MQQWFFFAAGGLSALWLLVHVFLGGRDIVRPALASGLSPVVRDTLYICWHFTTASIAMMAALFIWAGMSLNVTGATIASVLAAAFSLVGIVLVLRQGGRYRDLPQGWLFVPVALLGGIGLSL
ncbi:MAG: hypothetical protein HLUCCA08_18025 [Rhodobacteraceae bacterium HLUCCA08]|nr:MAG: hypothetical protein HLUCCA08_18025 [Rhodobacteraceae bacterium HLUCCA08]